MNVLLNPPQKTRFKFAAMVGVYFAGTLNDNFCRQCVMMLAVAHGLAYLQGYITVLFTLPFVLFAAYAGFLSDRFSKRSVAIAVKFVSLLAYILGAIGLYLMSWPIILLTVFILGIQATVFSPAINGTIPELYPPDYVVTANGIIVAAANIAILLGIAGAGVVLDMQGTLAGIPLGIGLAAAAGLGFAGITLIIALLVPKFPAASPKAAFPVQGPWESVKTLARTANDRLLMISIIAKAFFWFAGSLQILIIIPLGLTQFGLSKTMTSALVVIELVGIAAGSLLAPVFSKGPKWYRVLAPASFVMAAGMFVVALVPHLPASTHKIVVIATLATLGVAGGIFSIPVTSFVQVRPAPQFKGRMIASSNFADFVGILLSGTVFYILDKMRISPGNCFFIEGLMVTATSFWLLLVLGRSKFND
jgi:acyl-[acyl-carrier-protein]-phospholipid O-acyltransferase/long-chain-fatty-acid--[acyl-carrier-protein] ligase